LYRYTKEGNFLVSVSHTTASRLDEFVPIADSPFACVVKQGDKKKRPPAPAGRVGTLHHVILQPKHRVTNRNRTPPGSDNVRTTLVGRVINTLRSIDDSQCGSPRNQSDTHRE
jgi:hypothetical protein